MATFCRTAPSCVLLSPCCLTIDRVRLCVTDWWQYKVVHSFLILSPISDNGKLVSIFNHVREWHSIRLFLLPFSFFYCVMQTESSLSVCLVLSFLPFPVLPHPRLSHQLTFLTSAFFLLTALLPLPLILVHFISHWNTIIYIFYCLT